MDLQDVVAIRDTVQELDAAVVDNDMTDWELSFLASMMEKVKNRHRFFSPGQVEQIERLAEKYL
jgi:hypothetical protein